MRKSWIAYGVFLILVLMNVYFQLVLTDSRTKEMGLCSAVLYFVIMGTLFKLIDDRKRTIEENELLTEKNRKHMYRISLLFGSHLFFHFVFGNKAVDHFFLFIGGLYVMFLIAKYLIWRELHYNKK